MVLEAMELTFLRYRCQCNNTCGAGRIDGAPFRREAKTEAFLVAGKVTNLLESNTLWWLYSINLIVLIFIGAQGILGLIEIQYSQADVRNWLFRRLTNQTPLSKRETFTAKSSYYFAKGVAAGVYMFAIVVAVICPLIFVSCIVVNEIITWEYPSDEHYDAIGQVSCGFRMSR